MKDPVWGETDRSEYYGTIKIMLEELNATFHFVHSHLAEEMVKKRTSSYYIFCGETTYDKLCYCYTGMVKVFFMIYGEGYLV